MSVMRKVLLAMSTSPLLREQATKRAFVQISDLHGFAVVDFAQRKEVARVTLPNDIPAEQVDKGPFNGSPSHGIGVAPDGKTLWVALGSEAAVAVLDTVSHRVVARIPVGQGPHGIAFTADGKHVYVTNSDSNDVSVIDIATHKVIETIAVGKAPACL